MAISRKKVIAVKNRIVPVRDADPYAKVLLYGRNGHGKTRTAATAPKPLLIDIEEKGTKSVRGYKDVEVFPAESWEDIVYAYWYLRSGNHNYESVILDTLTMMQELCMKQVLKEAGDRDPLKDPATASQRDWGKCGTLMTEQLLNYRNLPMHVVFTAQERSVDNEDDSGEVTTERVPAMSAKPRGSAMSCVDFIGRVFKKEVRSVNKQTKKETRTWRTLMLIGPHEIYFTKDQSGMLPRIVAEPTIPMIIEAAKSLPNEDSVYG